MVFKILCILVLWTKVATALQELIINSADIVRRVDGMVLINIAPKLLFKYFYNFLFTLNFIDFPRIIGSGYGKKLRKTAGL